MSPAFDLAKEQVKTNAYNVNFKNTLSLSQRMEQTWIDFFNLPKGQRKQIKWNNKEYRIAVFEDMYLAQCQKEGAEPNTEIKEHFWKNCVDIQEYTPKYCKRDNITRK